MDPSKAGYVLKHLERQNELLLNAHNDMAQELHKLQVEEAMLMGKFYKVMTGLGLAKKGVGSANFGNLEDDVASEGTADGANLAAVDHEADDQTDARTGPTGGQ